MTRPLVPRFLAALDPSQLTDAEVHELVGQITTASKTSTLVLNNPPMAASVAALGTKEATLATSNTAVANDKVKLKTDLGTEALARADVEGELRTYVTFASNFAKSPADLQGAGVAQRAARPAKGSVPPVPGAIDSKIPVKGHGKLVVAVHETGSTHYHYVAEQSPDGTTWSALGVGRGKTRTLTGASGTKVWVRFATVRGQVQSDWNTATLVTIP
jgi:hypothetical protein